jgi:hypothetical protein
LYFSSTVNRLTKSRRISPAGLQHVGKMGKPCNTNILVRKPGGKSPLRMPWNRWTYNIKMALKRNRMKI